MEAGPRHPSGLQRAWTGVSEAPGRERQRGRESEASCTLASPRHGHPSGEGCVETSEGAAPRRPEALYEAAEPPKPPPPSLGGTPSPAQSSRYPILYLSPHLTPSIHQPSSPPIPLLTTHHHNSPLHLAPHHHHAPHQAPSPVARLLRPHGLICYSAPLHPIAATDSVRDMIQVSEPHEVTESLSARSQRSSGARTTRIDHFNESSAGPGVKGVTKG